MTDINKLEELAKAASELFVSGPWYYNDPDRFSQGHGKFSETAVYAAGNAFPWRVIEVVGDDDRSVALAKLIAELRPEVVVSLISQYRRMEEALRFYADERRYNGANQRPIPDDPYSPPDRAYIHDVTKDGGDIARQALQDQDQ